MLDEINERAVEAALQLKEAHDGSEVTVLTMGPDRATEAIRKALSMGADKAVHLSDEALRGSCAIQTARALATVIGTAFPDGFDLVLAGNEASDGRAAAVPAMVADLLGRARAHARPRDHRRGLGGHRAPGDRRRDHHADRRAAGGGLGRREDQRTALPVVQGDHGGEEEAGHHAHPGRRRVSTRPRSGLAHATSTVTSAQPKPPKSAGEKVTDEGDGGARIAAFLVAQKLI